MSLGFFWLICLVFETWSNQIIICFRRFLSKWSFWFPHKIFVYLKLKKKFFSKAAWVPIADMLLQLSNLNWSLSYCLKLRYINFFGSNFSKIFLRIVYIIWSLKPVSKEFVSRNKNFEFAISKSMHKPPSPLSYCKTCASKGNPSLLYSLLLCWNDQEW